MRRGALCLFLGWLPVFHVVQAADNTLSLIPDFFTDTVTVIDTSSQTVLTTLDLPTGTYARSGSLSPDGSKFYVGGFFGGFVVPIDVTTLTVGAPIGGIDPSTTAISGLSFSPDGTRVYAGNITNADQLFIIDATTDTLLQTLDGVCGAPREPAEVRATEDAVYFSCIRYGSFNSLSSIRRLDRNTLLITDVAEVGRGALTFDIHIPSLTLYAVNSLDASISVVDLASAVVTDTITGLIPSGSINPVDAGGITVSPDGETLYIGNTESDTAGLIVIDIATQTRTTVSTGSPVVGIDQSNTGEVLYAVGVGTGDVAVLDTTDNTVATIIETPEAEGAIVWGDFLRNVAAFVPGDFAIRGTLENLDDGDALTLQNNGGDDLTLLENGTFTFPSALPNGSTYAVSVLSAPPGEDCVVFNGSGVIDGADVTDLRVDCNTNDPDDGPDVEDISGRLSGLAAGLTVTLQNNGADDLLLSDNGVFTFATPVPDGGAYLVTVAVQPPGATCTVTNGSGTADKDVTNVAVVCVANRFPVGGTLSGLGGASLTLQNNGGDDLILDVNGSFAFAGEIKEGDSYSVTVATQPDEQTCSVSGGAGTVSGPVTSVSVACVTNSYLIGGSLNGLDAGEEVVLQNNGGDDLTLTADGDFAFSMREFTGGPYAVTVLSAPAGKDCNVGNASGNVDGADVSDVSVACTVPDPDPTPDIETIGGTVSGLAGGGTLVLQNNGGDNLTISANGPFVFATGVADGAAYLVTVAQQPDGQICSVSKGSGTATRDVSDVAVNCITVTFPVGGTVTGLAEGALLVLQSNGGDDRSVSANGSFVFPTELISGTAYTITVLTQPDGQTCSVSNGSGSADAAVTDVSVNCSNNISEAFSSARARPSSAEAGSDIALEVVVRDSAGAAVAGVPVTVSIESASVDRDAVAIATSPTSTDVDGRARFTLRSAIAQDVEVRVSFNPDLFVSVNWVSAPVPVAPPVPEAVPVPALGFWLLNLLSLSMAAMAMLALRSRATRRAGATHPHM